jgi:tRNA C32,U32 (ribose-2'-O)-methylase TrmJ
VELQPKRPPGRIDRKAAHYAADIARLRSAGYTYEAIREALADVGLAVSTSALRREVRWLRHHPPEVSPIPQHTAVTPAHPAPSPASPPQALPPSDGTPHTPTVEPSRASA